MSESLTALTVDGKKGKATEMEELWEERVRDTGKVIEAGTGKCRNEAETKSREEGSERGDPQRHFLI